MTLPLVVIIGPTASGKTELAIRVAERLIRWGQPAEIVNGDSMLVYRGMDIGTAKPSQDERARIPHHLVDIMNVTQTATVADFQSLARGTVSSLRERGVVPLLVGGSSLYVRAIVDEFDFPGTDPAVRARWVAALEQTGPEALHEQLRARAPQAAEAVEPRNGRRIVRALEVLELTGSFSGRLPQPRYALDEVHQFGLRLPRELMDERISRRVDRMWEQGLVDEVRGLVQAGLRVGLTASRGLGYQQVLAYLAGESTQEQARQATIDGTRRFARKQLGWFRRDPRISWIDHEDPRAVDIICQASGLNRP